MGEEKMTKKIETLEVQIRALKAQQMELAHLSTFLFNIAALAAKADRQDVIRKLENLVSAESVKRSIYLHTRLEEVLSDWKLAPPNTLN